MTRPQFTVSELSSKLKRTLEDEFHYIAVRGEVSGCKKHGSGHLYFALKDENAVLDGVCWRGVAKGLSFIPKDGMEVICYGKITTYAGRSKYQMMATAFEHAGFGELLQLLEERKKKLTTEGLFAQDRKKSIPFLPDTIGIITSETGAVIKDILHRLSDRFPVRVLLSPALMQGDGAAAQICRSILQFNNIPKGHDLRPDLLILARGGGSLEDLWAFNEENVVRAVANSEIPIITAVGHETDTTLVDYAADYRAPTPTGAAEKAVPVRMELISRILDIKKRLTYVLDNSLRTREQKLEILYKHLPALPDILREKDQRLDDYSERLHNTWGILHDRLFTQIVTLKSRLRHPKEIYTHARTHLDGISDRLNHSLKAILLEKHQNLRSYEKLLQSYSYTNTLKRGFTLVRDKKGKAITSKSIAENEPDFQVVFHDGTVTAQSIKKSRAKIPRSQGKASAKPQGSLW